MAAAAAVLLLAAPARASNCGGTSTGRVPLGELGAGLYLGQFAGGLYPNGSNAIPQAHLNAGLTAASAIVPRNAAGAIDAQQGRVVLLSIGMSNTTIEFCTVSGTTGCTPESFMGQAAADPDVNHTTLAIVNGAISGQAAGMWVDPNGTNYDSVATVLASQGLSELQVQAVWVKQADPNPTTSLPSAGADVYTLEGRLAGIARALRTRYPNLKQVFYSSRIYAGYASSTLNPEPYAYEGGFAVKWLIEAQIRQMATPGTPSDPVAGDLDYGSVAPWIAWGPYLWADGTHARADGLVYLCSDFIGDGTHPAEGAARKVGTMLLDFLLTSPVTRAWFRADAGTGTTTTSTTSRTSTTTPTTTTIPSVVCGPQPRPGCQGAAPGRAMLSLLDSPRDEGDRLRWRWFGSANVPKAAFGAPTTGTGYVVCLYDASGLRLQAVAPGGGTCGGVPCWRDLPTGFRYDTALGPDGLQRIVLAAGAPRRAKIGVRGKGANLSMPPLPLGIPVRMQLLRSGSNTCWEARYSGTRIRNGGGRFKAKSD